MTEMPTRRGWRSLLADALWIAGLVAFYFVVSSVVLPRLGFT